MKLELRRPGKTPFKRPRCGGDVLTSGQGKVTATFWRDFSRRQLAEEANQGSINLSQTRVRTSTRHVPLPPITLARTAPQNVSSAAQEFE